MVLTMAEALEGQDSCMMREENRLSSFNGWPINEGLCVPTNVSIPWMESRSKLSFSDSDGKGRFLLLFTQERGRLCSMLLLLSWTGQLGARRWPMERASEKKLYIRQTGNWTIQTDIESNASSIGRKKCESPAQTQRVVSWKSNSQHGKVRTSNQSMMSLLPT